MGEEWSSARAESESRGASFGQEIHPDFGFFVQEFGPAAGSDRQQFKPRDRSGPKEFVHHAGRQRDIDILSDPADETMMPHCPAATQDRLGLDRLENAINRDDDASVAAGQILRLEHLSPPRQQFVGKLEALLEKPERHGAHADLSYAGYEVQKSWGMNGLSRVTPQPTRRKLLSQ